MLIGKNCIKINRTVLSQLPAFHRLSCTPWVCGAKQKLIKWLLTNQNQLFGGFQTASVQLEVAVEKIWSLLAVLGSPLYLVTGLPLVTVPRKINKN